MALVLHNPGANPLGQFDGYTGETLNFKGGEICTWAAMPFPATGAADVDNDGYVPNTGFGKEVPGVSRSATSLTSTARPLFLSDDGITYYGTLFGAVVGGSVGTQVNGPNSFTGAVLGPHTATGSGKVTVWDKPGLYGTTLDAVDTAAGGLIPNSTTSLTVGTPITYTSTGLLTPVASGNGVAGAPVVARLASFETNGSLVTTPTSLVSALNSPSGSVTSLTQLKFYQVVYWYAGAQGGA